MRKAWLLASREIRDLLSDRSTLLGFAVLLLVPVLPALSVPAGRAPGALIFIFALESAFLPTMMSVNVAAASFVQEKEAQTLLPLLAAPIRDRDIVVGKMLAVVLPATFASWLAITAYYFIASARFGAAITAATLTPGVLGALGVLSFFFVLSLGSWMMVLSTRVRSVRGAQQTGGLLIGLLVAALVAVAGFLGRTLDGWLLVVAVVALLGLDIAMLELARRLWRRDEAIARL